MIRLTDSTQSFLPYTLTLLRAKPTVKKLFPEEVDIQYMMKLRSNLRSILYGATGGPYIELVEMNELYYDLLPKQYAIVPAFAGIDKQHTNFIVVNQELATIKENEDDKITVVVNNIADLAGAVLFGISQLIGYTIDDITILSRLYQCVVDYIHSLFLRTYNRSANLYSLDKDQLLTLYIIIANTVGPLFFNVASLSDRYSYNMIMRTVNNFAKTNKLATSAVFKIERMINDIGLIDSWQMLTEKLAEFNILHISMDNLKVDFAQYSGYLLLMLSGGVMFVTVMSALRVNTSYFPILLKQINVRAFNKLNAVLNEYVEGVVHG